MALEPDRASGTVTQRRGVISTGTLAQLGERVPYKHQVASSILARPTILKALSQVGKARDSESRMRWFEASRARHFNDLRAVLVSLYKVRGVCSLVGRTVVATIAGVRSPPDTLSCRLVAKR